jgi:hypothetical protein
MFAQLVLSNGNNTLVDNLRHVTSLWWWFTRNYLWLVFGYLSMREPLVQLQKQPVHGWSVVELGTVDVGIALLLPTPNGSVRPQSNSVDVNDLLLLDYFFRQNIFSCTGGRGITISAADTGVDGPIERRGLHLPGMRVGGSAGTCQQQITSGVEGGG